MKSKKIELISLTGLIFLYIIAIVNTQEYNSSSNPIEILTLSDIDYFSTSTSDLYEWNRTWGGALSDYGESVALDSSDNIYLAGYTANFGAGDNDMVLVK